MSSTQIDTMLWHTQTRRAGDTGRQGRKPGKETTMTTKEMIRSEYAKVWARDQKMVDYCAGKVAAVAILNDGLVYPERGRGDSRGVQERRGPAREESRRLPEALRHEQGTRLDLLARRLNRPARPGGHEGRKEAVSVDGEPQR